MATSAPPERTAAFLSAAGSLIDYEFSPDSADPFTGTVIILGESACLSWDRGNTLSLTIDALVLQWELTMRQAVETGAIEPDSLLADSASDEEGFLGFVTAVAFGAAAELCPQHWDRIEAEVNAGG